MGNRRTKLRPREAEELAQATHFSTSELQYWYAMFLQDCPSGTMNSEDFCRIHQQHFPSGGAPDLASLIYNSFERNESGLVEFRQFICSLSVTLRGTREEKLEWLFKLCDEDRDGFVSREEMIAVTEALYQHLGHMVEFTSEEDMPPQHINTHFHVDEGSSLGDHYRKIEKEEFFKMVTANHSFEAAVSVCDRLNKL